MINGKKVVAIIPARSGSKSVPQKNIYPLAGKPLIQWTIETASKCSSIDRIIVSTDGKEIANVAKDLGVEVKMRPADLATDTALVIDTLRYLIKEIKAEDDQFEYMVLLEATSPLRSADDVEGCIQKLEDHDSVATFTQAHLNPHRAWKIDQGKPMPFIEGANPWSPRQQLPEAFQLNGAVYAFSMSGLPATGPGVLFGNIGAVTMPAERSIDIDEKQDFMITEQLLKQRKLL